MNLAEELTARGLVEHTSAPLETILGAKRTVYLGVDPSADSMQAGNLVVVLLMKRLSDAGHRIMLLVGGGTGMIGDPRDSGERQLSDPKIVARNKKAIQKQMQRIVGTSVPVVDNADWLLKVKLVDFLRDIGKHFTVNELVKRDIIRRRLETPDESISYTEFAYSLLQGYDYLVLNRKRGVDLQIGASDQWTNILSGVELIRRKDSREAFALTCPLVTDASGKKFGKSEGNAVWLDAEKTTPFAFYQFWFNQPDSVVEKYLKMYTFLSLEQIEELMTNHNKNPSARHAQRKLAADVTELVHGRVESTKALIASTALYGKHETLTKEALDSIPSVPFDSSAQATVVSHLASGLSLSKSEARRLIDAKGVRLNGSVISFDRALTAADFTDGIALLEKGKTRLVVRK